MDRHVIDRVISYIGLLLAAVLVAGSVVLFFTYDFIHGQVSTQLGAQKIYFPEKSSSAFSSLPEKSQQAMEKYAGTQLSTGAGAQVYADDYIAVHLSQIGNGMTYSELSAESMKNPDDKELAAKVAKVFQGESLRGTLLNAYAFDTMATVARFVAIGALVAGILLLPLSYFGFRHAKKVKAKSKKK